MNVHTNVTQYFCGITIFIKSKGHNSGKTSWNVTQQVTTHAGPHAYCRWNYCMLYMGVSSGVVRDGRWSGMGGDGILKM